MNKTNYTPEQTSEIVATYEADPTRDTVNRLAEQFDKPIKSIIGKLSREGVYRREEYVGKTGDKPITKIEMTTLLGEALEMDLEGLEKCPKQVLKALCEKFGVDL